MKVLITGSSGQIGTNVALALQARGDKVIGIDRRPNAWSNAVDTRLFDLLELAKSTTPHNLVGLRPGDIDAVVHLAAYAKVHELVKQPHKAFENVLMLQPALEIARALNVPILFGSSREVYGDILRHVTEESMADFIVAESPYSASKIAGEAFFASYSRCYGLKTLIFRFSNVYGRYDNDLDRMTRVIPLFVRSIARGEPIVVFGRDKMLDFTYIDDCVSGIVAGIDAITTGRISNQTINLAYGQGQTLFDLVTLIELATGKTANAAYKPSQTGEVTRYVADISKARQLLGYAPQTPLSKGIVHYIQYCRANGFI